MVNVMVSMKIVSTIIHWFLSMSIFVICKNFEVVRNQLQQVLGPKTESKSEQSRGAAPSAPVTYLMYAGLSVFIVCRPLISFRVLLPLLKNSEVRRDLIKVVETDLIRK